MTRLATHNRRGRRRAERQHWTRQLILRGAVTEVRAGDKIWIHAEDGALVDQHGREWTRVGDLPWWPGRPTATTESPGHVNAVEELWNRWQASIAEGLEAKA